jgi:chemotaxis protein histidine kinase CheA
VADALAETAVSVAALSAAPTLDTLVADYEQWTLSALAGMRAALGEAQAHPESPAEPLRRIFEAAHDLKGQGTSFGYPLITRIAQSLCRLGHRPCDAAGAAEHLRVVAAHLDVLALILQKQIRGDGGPLGAKLAAKLESMAAT